MKGNFVKLTSAVMSAIVLFAGIPYDASGKSAGINVNYHTTEEIKEYINDHPFYFSGSVFTVEPDYTNSPYSPGSLDQSTLQNALNALNTMRFIAGIDEVGLSSEYNDIAQAGALLNAVNGTLSHNPDQPSDMSYELYTKGRTGTSSSNLGRGYASLSQDIIYGWMSDAGSTSNVSTVGHRRWCLSPGMEETGFGNVGKFYAMYVMDNVWAETPYYGVCWPAQVMPLDYFDTDDPWSISMGYNVDISKVEVTLVRNSDGRTWKFSQSSSDGFFNVENSNYGKTGCIIFRPNDISYRDGDRFDVSITGLDEDVNYSVEFADIFAKPVTEVSLTELANFILNRQYNAEEVVDFSGDDRIDVFDVVCVLERLERK